jgi:hypothetical protein
METKCARTGVENNLSVLIKKRRYSAALHNVAVIHAPVAAKLDAFRTNFSARVLKSGSGVSLPEPLVLLRQNYCGRGGGVSFGCLFFPPPGCPCPWP